MSGLINHRPPGRTFWDVLTSDFIVDYGIRVGSDKSTYGGLLTSVALRALIPGLGWFAILPTVGVLLHQFSDEARKKQEEQEEKT